MKREKPILSCSNNIMDILYKNIKEAHEEANVNDSTVLKVLLELDQELVGLGGVCVDIAEEFENQPKSLALFIDLVVKAIQKAQEKGDCSSKVYPMLYYFEDELFDYLQELLNINKEEVVLDSIEGCLSLRACNKQGLLKGIWQSYRYITDFIDIYQTFWDLKIPISKNKQKLHIFNAQAIIDLLKERRSLGHKSIVDITKLAENEAEALIKTLEEQFNQQSFNTIVVVHRESPLKSRKFENE